MIARLARGFLVVLGLLGLVVGVTSVASPGLVAAIPVQTLESVAGNDYVVVAAVGALALLIAIVALGGRTATGIDQAETPDPEEVWGAPRLGARFDCTVDRNDGILDDVVGRGNDRVRSRLRESAIAVQMRSEGCGRPEARRAVERGTWTDDDVAAAFLAGDDGPTPSFSDRVAARLRGSSWLAHGADRTVDAIVSAHERAEGARR